MYLGLKSKFSLIREHSSKICLHALRLWCWSWALFDSVIPIVMGRELAELIFWGCCSTVPTSFTGSLIKNENCMKVIIKQVHLWDDRNVVEDSFKLSFWYLWFSDFFFPLPPVIMLYAIAGEEEKLLSKPCTLWDSEIHVSWFGLDLALTSCVYFIL